MIAALLFTMFIEVFQLATGIGIFELDDIFNNVLGALIGYGIIMALISAIKPNKNKGLKMIGFLSPLLITVLVFLSIFVYYDNKELGNIAQDYIYKVNLKDTNIDMNNPLNENKDLVPIYKAPTYNEDEAIQWANDFFNNMGIEASDLEINAYNDNAIFWRRGEPTYNIWFSYIGGRYSFTDFSHFNDGLEPMNIEEDLLLNTINGYGINIPDEAKFIIEEKGRYQWKVDKLINGDILIDGLITCIVDFLQHALKTIQNFILNLIQQIVFILIV